MRELIELSEKARKFMSMVENIIKTQNVDEFMALETTLDELKRAREILRYLEDLSEDFLYMRFLPVLSQPCSSSAFLGFDQDHRDSLVRLRHRAVIHMLQGSVPVAPRVEAASCTDAELRAMVTTLQSQFKYQVER